MIEELPGISMVMRTEDILGYSVATASLEAVVEGLVEGMGGVVKPFWLACLNPHSAQMAMSDPAAEAALKAANILIPNGVGVMLASRILGGGIRERITGSDIFRELSHRLNDRGALPFFSWARRKRHWRPLKPS